MDVELFSCIPWGIRGVDGFRQCCLPGAETLECAAIPYDPPEDEGHHKRSGNLLIDPGTKRSVDTSKQNTGVSPKANVPLKQIKVSSTDLAKSWAPEVKQYTVEGKPNEVVCFVVPDYTACYWSYANDEFGYDIRYERQEPTDKCVEAWSPQKQTWYKRCCAEDENKYLTCLLKESEKHSTPGAHELPKFQQTPTDVTFVRDGDPKHKNDYYTGGIYCDEIIDISKRPPPNYDHGNSDATTPGLTSGIDL